VDAKATIFDSPCTAVQRKRDASSVNFPLRADAAARGAAKKM
jgi:hypothetical protein